MIQRKDAIRTPSLRVNSVASHWRPESRRQEAVIRIDNIELDGFESGARSGSVTLVSGDRRINLPLTLPEDAGAEGLIQRLVAEAIRLARRMPEFRTGQSRLSFAPRLIARHR